MQHFQYQQGESLLGTTAAAPSFLDPTLGCMAAAASSTATSTGQLGGGGPLLATGTNLHHHHHHHHHSQHLLDHYHQNPQSLAGIGAPMTTAQPPAPRHTTTATNPTAMLNRQSQTSFSENSVRGLRNAASYDFGRVLGNGSFGVVCEARCLETGEQVAIKKVLQDPRYKNRELDVMKELNHPNVVTLKDYFYTDVPVNNNNAGNEQRETQRFLNVVMDYVPDTVYRVMKTFTRNNQPLPTLLVRLYTYQMCRSLGYLHCLGICHRDIKPQNLLVDSRTHILKLCDFGSAKRLLPGEHSVSYICSRFYRAPELMLGATEYSTAIDIWSIGCVLGELLLGKPLFAGDTSVDQLVKIIQVLGTPTRRQMQAMNPNYTEFRFPDVRSKDWRSVFSPVPGAGAHVTDDALDLLDQLLRYEPGERLTAYESLAHPFFDSLRQPGCRLPEGSPLPSIFDFTEEELRCMSPRTRAKVIPEWLKNNSRQPQQSPHQQQQQSHESIDPQRASPLATLRQMVGQPTTGTMNPSDSMNMNSYVAGGGGVNPLNVSSTLFQQLQPQQVQQAAAQQPQHNNHQQQFWR